MFRWSARRVGTHRARSGTALVVALTLFSAMLDHWALHFLQLRSQLLEVITSLCKVLTIQHLLLYILRVETPEELLLPPRY